MIGSPERVEIQRSLVQNLRKIEQQLIIIGRFLTTLLGIKIPQRVTTTFWGHINIKNEISTIKLLRVQIFSKIQQLLKNHYLRGFLTFSGVKMPAMGPQQLFGVKISSKMDSAPSNYYECKFSEKSDNF